MSYPRQPLTRSTSTIEVDDGFLKTRQGILLAVQVLTGGVGGVMCALQIMGTVFETALFMASFGLSGFFLLTHLFMLNENLAAKYPKLGIIHMMYLLLGTVLSLVLTIYRFLAWSLVSICLWILLIAFIVDLVDRFRQYRNRADEGYSEI